ncbi:probable leucine-rich repeat receptor-like protein kinase At1g35710 [Punica granatum]|uniref:Probable leucine-rich repeat receptor-like protein kinase At1g35710 n=1 Tax=Punica granatum TaxID=22663 RepID=A0A6P8C7R3_PUNGR|nr:probable leucine-rich repeat receptor-like protein kinase At1g35710 [Punica granatum]
MTDASDYAIGAVLGQRMDKRSHVIYYASKPWDAAQRNYSTTEKELLAIEFDLEIKDRKGSENSVADHLSRLVRDEEPLPISDSFPDEHLFHVQGEEPWYADLVNFIVTAKATRTNDAKVVVGFLKSNIFSRFGIPRAIISDQGTHFCNRSVEALMKKYGVHHRVATTYHPQSNGQAEVSNREVKSILEKTVNPSRKDWSLRLDDALWAYRTAYKTPIGKLSKKRIEGNLMHVRDELETIEVSRWNCKDTRTSVFLWRETGRGGWRLRSVPQRSSVFMDPCIAMRANLFRLTENGNLTVGCEEQRSISALILSNSSISDIIPNWFYNSSSNIEGLDLSKNELIGQIQERFDDMMPKLLNGTLTGKCLSGGIPVSLCKMKDLFVLDLSNNQLSGTLPDWWKSLRQLGGLNLGKNNLSGKIPTSMRSPPLTFLGLHDNDFHGILSRCLSNMTSLYVLDLSRNELSGRVPSCIGQLFQLIVLNLESNTFCQSPGLSLAQNRISGIISLCFDNLTILADPKSAIFGFYRCPAMYVKRDSYLGNDGLCGPPLSKNRPGDHEQSDIHKQIGDESDGRDESYTRWLYAAIARVTLASSNNEAGTTIVIVKRASSASSTCIKTEREALLRFKQVLVDYSNCLSSWTEEDCCSWEGVRCSESNLCQLSELRLAYNSFHGDIYKILGDSSACFHDTLSILNLGNNNVSGHLGNEIGSFKNLEFIDLSKNSVEGLIPTTLGQLQSLKYLNLRENKLSGSIPRGIGQLSNLYTLDVSNNHLNGVVTEVHLANLTSLTRLDISMNELAVSINPAWTAPFQLKYIGMSNCRAGPQFPTWLQSQRHISGLDLSNTSIATIIPYWLSNISSVIKSLDLSKNRLTGNIPGGFGDTMAELEALSLSDNFLNGSIPDSFCKMKELILLDLSNCWGLFFSNQLRYKAAADCSSSRV